MQFWLDTEAARKRLTVTETVEKDPGRIEIRCYALSNRIDGLEAKSDWAALNEDYRLRLLLGQPSPDAP